MAERKMKDSGIEWIGEIPKDWKVIKLRYLISDYKTGPFGSTLRIDKILTQGELYKDSLIYAPEHIAKQNMDLSSNTFISKERESELSQFEVMSGDIIFPIVGSLGRAMEIKEGMPKGIINSRLGKFRINECKINKEFFMRLFAKSEFLHTYIGLNMHGAIIVNLTKELFCNMPIPMPPMEEQTRIAAFLDEKVGQIDAVISKTKETIEEYKKLKQSVITEAVTKGLDPDAEMKDSGIEWIGEIPKTWEVKRFKFAVNSLFKGNGITKEEVIENGDIQCVRYGEIYTKYNEDFATCLSKTTIDKAKTQVHIKKGDLLFSGTGELVEEIGKNVVYMGDDDCLAGGDIIVASHSQNPMLLNYALNSTYCQLQKSFGKSKLKVVHISQGEIGNIIVALPPIEEQNKIAIHLKTVSKQYESIIHNKSKVIEELETYKKSLIYEYVTGKKEVC